LFQFVIAIMYLIQWAHDISRCVELHVIYSIENEE